MKLRTFREAEAVIAGAGSGTVLAVAGPEPCQTRWLMERMTSAFRTLRYDILRFGAAGIAEGDIRRHLHENSFLSAGKLLVITEVHSLGRKPAEELQDALARGFSDGALFLASTKTPRESALLKKLEQSAPLFTSYEPFDRDMAGWVSRIAREEEVVLDAAAAALLVEYSGRSLQRLGEALLKLSLYHGRGSRVDASGLKEVLSGKNRPDVFHLGDCLFAGKRGEAVRALAAMVADGEEPLAILAYLFGLWQKVLTAADVIASGGGQSEVAAATGSAFPVLGKIMGFATVAARLRTDPAEAAGAFESADRGLKSGEDTLAVFARLFFSLTSSGSSMTIGSTTDRTHPIVDH